MPISVNSTIPICRCSIDLLNPPSHHQRRFTTIPNLLLLPTATIFVKRVGLRRLQAGDFLFFLARLVPYTGQQFDEKNARFALIGYLEIKERFDNPDDPMFTSPAF